MQDGQRLQAFVDSIFSIDPTFANMFGSGLPGMSATSASVTGTSSSGADIVTRLHKETVLFVESINSPSPDKQTVNTHATAIAGYLRSLETLGQINHDACASLLDDLNHIVVG